MLKDEFELIILIDTNKNKLYILYLFIYLNL